MTTLSTLDTHTLVQQLSEKSGLNEADITQKMNEKVQKFSGLLTEQGALVLLSKDLQVTLPTLEKNNTIMKLGELAPGMNNVDVHAHVKIMDRIKPFSKNGKEGKYVSIRLKDETGEALFTFWNEHAEEALQKGLRAGSKMILTNARVGTFNGQTQLSLGYNGTYTIENDTFNMEMGKKPMETTPTEIHFSSLQENQFVEGKAHIVEVLPGKGYYVRCLHCQGKLSKRENVCPICMKEGKIDTRLLVPILLDDGTKTIRAVAFENEVVSLYGKPKEELLRAFETDKTLVDRELWGRIIQFSGKTKMGMDHISLEIVLSKVKTVSFANA
mgnify:CR=1 FL=1